MSSTNTTRQGETYRNSFIITNFLYFCRNSSSASLFRIHFRHLKCIPKHFQVFVELRRKYSLLRKENGSFSFTEKSKLKCQKVFVLNRLLLLFFSVRTIQTNLINHPYFVFCYMALLGIGINYINLITSLCIHTIVQIRNGSEQHEW
jgi:hypothetical protein